MRSCTATRCSKSGCKNPRSHARSGPSRCAGIPAYGMASSMAEPYGRLPTSFLVYAVTVATRSSGGIERDGPPRSCSPGDPGRDTRSQRRRGSAPSWPQRGCQPSSASAAARGAGWHRSPASRRRAKIAVRAGTTRLRRGRYPSSALGGRDSTHDAYSSHIIDATSTTLRRGGPCFATS